MQTRMLVSAAALAAFALAGCASDAPAGSRAALEQPGTWTVLTYSIADTNLENFMMDDLDELGTVGDEENVNLVALVDRSEGYTDQEVLGMPDWSGAKLLELGRDGGEELDDLGDVNTGDPDLLADFIADGIERYRADHYALVITLSDGIDISIAYLSLFADPDEGAVQAEVPLSYSSPQGDAAGDLILSAVIHLELVVVDFGGDLDSVSGMVTVP
ncbi:MAG TPA: clostripain-related cysteine peptidase [Rhodoglobus sp.]|nr:clostripain-related cysteine peptidase [Rhodoglobus sp.]